MKLVSDNLVSRIDEAVSAVRADATSGGIFFRDQLDHVIAEVLTEEERPLEAFTFLPMDTSVPAHKKTFTRRMLKNIGVTQRIANYADDLPTVGVDASEETFQTENYGNSVVYSVDDVAAAQAEGIPLESAMMAASRRSALEKMNDVAWNGDAAAGTYGALTYPHIPRVALADKIDSSVAADTILAMLNSFVTGIVKRTNRHATGFRIGVATDQYAYMATTPRSANSDTTILEFFLMKNTHVDEVVPLLALDEAGPNGEDLVLAIVPNRRSIGHIVPRSWTPQPVQARNLAFVVPTLAKSGGCASDFPFHNAIGILPA